MRPIRKLIQLDQAMEIVMRQARPVTESEKVPLLGSLDRVCSSDVIAKLHVPPFARAAMDGYAVRAKDTFGATKMHPIGLKKIETVYAGGVPKKTVGPGTCSEVATGAMLPKGADAVVMVEDTESRGDRIAINESVHPGKNVSKKGEDISPGTRLVARNEVLNPSKIGALAALGIKETRVFRKPLVGIVPTGDEIAELGRRLKPGQVYNINSYTLASVVSANGGRDRVLPIVSDTVKDVSRTIVDNSDCDMLVFSGGSSVGERDIMLDVLEKNGEVLFHGIAVKPGKPTLFGAVREQLIFGMPGYPTSCLSNAYMILAPVLRHMAHLPRNERPSVLARMAKRVVSTTGRTQFLTVKLENGRANPVFKESGAITSMAFADGYVMIPADVDLVEKDEEIRVYLL